MAIKLLLTPDSCSQMKQAMLNEGPRAEQQRARFTSLNTPLLGWKRANQRLSQVTGINWLWVITQTAGVCWCRREIRPWIHVALGPLWVCWRLSRLHNWPVCLSDIGDWSPLCLVIGVCVCIECNPDNKHTVSRLEWTSKQPSNAFKIFYLFNKNVNTPL